MTPDLHKERYNRLSAFGHICGLWVMFAPSVTKPAQLLIPSIVES